MSIKQEFKNIIETEFEELIDDLEIDVDVDSLMRCMLRVSTEGIKVNTEVRTSDNETINVLNDKVYFRISKNDKYPTFGFLSFDFNSNTWHPYGRKNTPFFLYRDNFDKHIELNQPI